MVKTDKYHSKLTYDSVTGLFDGFIIYKVTWMDDDSYYVTMGSENDPRPVVEGPNKNGTFPFISSSQWDRWVTYDGKADTVMPTEPISSVLECEAYLAELSKNYPEINDWEIVYEDCYYELTYCYDPYTYSFREIYMPERFAVNVIDFFLFDSSASDCERCDGYTIGCRCGTGISHKPSLNYHPVNVTH